MFIAPYLRYGDHMKSNFIVILLCILDFSIKEGEILGSYNLKI